MKMVASSFADPADVRAFQRCKAKGHSDEYCFNFGDNAIGYWSDSTGEGTGPSVALHRRVLNEHFGDNWKKEAHLKKVIIKYRDKTVEALIKDICGKRDRVDLNPDAVAGIGLRPPILVEVEMEWV